MGLDITGQGAVPDFRPGDPVRAADLEFLKRAALGGFPGLFDGESEGITQAGVDHSVRRPQRFQWFALKDDYAEPLGEDIHNNSITKWEAWPALFKIGGSIEIHKQFGTQPIAADMMEGAIFPGRFFLAIYSVGFAKWVPIFGMQTAFFGHLQADLLAGQHAFMAVDGLLEPTNIAAKKVKVNAGNFLGPGKKLPSGCWVGAVWDGGNRRIQILQAACCPEDD